MIVFLAVLIKKERGIAVGELTHYLCLEDRINEQMKDRSCWKVNFNLWNLCIDLVHTNISNQVQELLAAEKRPHVAGYVGITTNQWLRIAI